MDVGCLLLGDRSEMTALKLNAALALGLIRLWSFLAARQTQLWILRRHTGTKVPHYSRYSVRTRDCTYWPNIWIPLRLFRSPSHDIKDREMIDSFEATIPISRVTQPFQ
jgi:hypothetical protein